MIRLLFLDICNFLPTHWPVEEFELVSCLSSGRGLFFHGLALIPTWMSNYMPSKNWDENIYLLPNFNRVAVESLGTDK